MTIRALLACFLLIVVVITRFFTETVPVLPRVLNFADLVLLIMFGALVTLSFTASRRTRLRHLGLWGPLRLFVFIFLVSAIVNTLLFGNSILLALADFVFYLEPILFALIFTNLGWSERDTYWLTRVFVALALVQIPVGLIQIPRALAYSSEGADYVSGTFGTNGSQMGFFLAQVGGYMVGRYLIERKVRWLLPLPIMLIVFYASGFKVMWVSLPLTVVLVILAFTSVQPWRKILLVALIGLASGVGALVVGSRASSVTVGNWEQVFSSELSQELTQIGKTQAILSLVSIYQEAPHAVLVGVGPGAYSSRAFQAFVNPTGNESMSNVTRDYVSTIEPSIWAQRYVIPLISRPGCCFLGSGTVDWPFSSYISLLSELGVVGLLAYLWAYYLVFARVWMKSRQAWRERDVQRYAVSIGGMVGLLFLAQMAFLDNWFETSRVVVPLWLMLVPLLMDKPEHRRLLLNSKVFPRARVATRRATLLS